MSENVVDYHLANIMNNDIAQSVFSGKAKVARKMSMKKLKTIGL